MSVRRAIVEARLDGLNVSEFCRAHGVSTWFFYDLRRRHARDGDAVLEPRSRAPVRVANRTSPVLEDRIVELRKRLEGDGLDAGPATIAFHLGGEAPSEATIWRVLSRRGFIVPAPHKAPRSAFRSFTAERANQCWQIDDTIWWLADGREVKIVDVIDDCTRVAVASRAVASCTGQAAVEAVLAGASNWGLPEQFLSDNAIVFRHHLTDTLAALGIAAGHSRPYHPQTCGKVERFHQTVKRFLAKQPAPDDLAELQHQLDAFCEIYNHHRPHRALGRRFPAQVWDATPRSGPAATALTEPTRVGDSIVSALGHATLGRRYRISIGNRYAGRTATIVATGRTGHVFVDGHLVRQLTLNPARMDQPLYDRPGRRPQPKP